MRYFLYAILFVLTAAVISACGGQVNTNDLLDYEYQRRQEELRNANLNNTNFSYELSGVGCSSGPMPIRPETEYYDMINENIKKGARYLYDVYTSRFVEDISYFLLPPVAGSTCKGQANGTITENATDRSYIKKYETVNCLGCNNTECDELKRMIFQDEGGSITYVMASSSGSGLSLNDPRDTTACIKSDGTSGGQVQYRYVKKAG